MKKAGSISRIAPFCAAFLVFLLAAGCASAPDGRGGFRVDRNEADDSGVIGFGILYRLPGLWHGPVSTTTPAGSFPMWCVDFRPVSAGQVSQYSQLDPDTINYLSFFVVKHDGALKIAMRTERVASIPH